MSLSELLEFLEFHIQHGTVLSPPFWCSGSPSCFYAGGCVFHTCRAPPRGWWSSRGRRNMVAAGPLDLPLGVLSHRAGPLAAYYKLPLDHVVLIFDDMSLPCGVLRLQQGGGHGGHNGLRSIIHHFRGNKEFVRLRIGISRPPGQMDPKAFVLQRFNATAHVQIETALHEGVGILKTLLAKGLTECARSANTEQKYKHLRPQAMPS